MSGPDEVKSLSPELAMEILNKILEELQKPENVKKLDEARDNIGNEMMKMMQYLFPIVMKIEMQVIKEFGFREGREGSIKFAMIIRALEDEDAEVARLHSLIKAYYLPPLDISTLQDTSTTTTKTPVPT